MNATIAIIEFIIVYVLILTEKVHRAIAALLGGIVSPLSRQRFSV